MREAVFDDLRWSYPLCSGSSAFGFYHRPFTSSFTDSQQDYRNSISLSIQDRYLAGLPQRSGFEIALISAVKFVLGVALIWLIYFIAVFMRRGFSRTKS
jgi:hypothetical protein